MEENLNSTTKNDQLAHDQESNEEEARITSSIQLEIMESLQHDFRTPFNGILGLGSYLAMEETDELKKEYLNDIVSCAQRLLDYAENILDFSDIDTGGWEIRQEEFDFRDVIKGVIEVYTPSAYNKKLKLHSSLARNLPDRVIGDKRRLCRILLNLIENSIKFTSEGEVKLSVKMAEEQVNSDMVFMFTIKDTGIGIPKERQKVIFDKYVKVLPSYRGLYRGLGLGLTIVRRFIEELDGRFKLQSKEGKGTKFMFTLPFMQR